jgi:general stress protein 26
MTDFQPVLMANHDDMRPFVLDSDAERQLLDEQSDLTFCWLTRDGSPMSVVMSFVHHDGRFWVTGARQRKRFAAVVRDPRVALTVSGMSTTLGHNVTVSYKATAIIHEDRATKDWFYPALTRRLHAPKGEEYMGDFLRMLDSPSRVILELVTGARVGYDGRKMQASMQHSRDEGYLADG